MYTCLKSSTWVWKNRSLWMRKYKNYACALLLTLHVQGGGIIIVRRPWLRENGLSSSAASRVRFKALWNINNNILIIFSLILLLFIRTYIIINYINVIIRIRNVLSRIMWQNPLTIFLDDNKVYFSIVAVPIYW